MSLTPHLLAPGSVYHSGFVVRDLQAAMRSWADQAGFGPFFLFENFAFVQPIYRGRPARGPAVTLAFAYSGDTLLELIQPLDQIPSVYREREPGLHHLGIATSSLDEGLAPYVEAGLEIAFRGGFAFGGGCAYIDTTRTLGVMLELVEIAPPIEGMLAQMKSAHASWDRRRYTASLA
jgi:hypothetical protein